MDIDALETAHNEYQMMQHPQFLLKAVLPNGEYLALRKTLSETIPDEDEVDAAISRMVISSRADTARQLKTLMGDVTAYQIEKTCGVNRRMIDLVLAEERTAPKLMMYALCLFFELSYEEALKLLYKCGYSFSGEIPDTLIQSYLKTGIYRISDWADAVIAAYDAAGVTPPDFFANGVFVNGTISDVK